MDRFNFTPNNFSVNLIFLNKYLHIQSEYSFITRYWYSLSIPVVSGLAICELKHDPSEVRLLEMASV